MTNLGHIAYNAYGDHRRWVTFAGSPMPSWDDQDSDLRQAWEAAATAIAAAVMVRVAGALRSGDDDNLRIPAPQATPTGWPSFAPGLKPHGRSYGHVGTPEGC